MSKKCTVVLKNHSRIVAEENGRKVTFLNPRRKEYHVTQIDGCVITKGVRCDSLVTEVGEASVLIEFKGADLGHAVEQLYTTASNHEVKKLLEKRIGFLVLCSRFPRFDTSVAKAKDRFAKLYKAGFHVYCDQREVKIERVVRIAG